MSHDPKLSAYEMVFGKDTWMRGARLGILLSGMFALGALLLFALFSLLTGWVLAARLLAALLVGPFLGVAMFWIYWKRTKS